MEAIVWSKDGCPDCLVAKRLLQAKGILFEERNISRNWRVESLQAMIPGVRSLPQVFIDDELVGGLENLKKYLKV